MNIVPKILIAFAIAYVILCIFVFYIQKDLIFFPSKEISVIPEYKNLKELHIKTKEDIRLNAWFLDNKSDKTIIFLHGNGWNIGYNEWRLKIFDWLWVNALMVDYRGYWKSEGELLKEQDIYDDAEAAYEYVVKSGVPSRNIIIWGQSLGWAVAINLAQNKHVYATIIESSFYSMDEMASKNYAFLPTWLLLRFHFRSDEKISNIHSPIYVIHSPEDEIISYSNWQRLYAKISLKKAFLETKGSHNGWFSESYSLYLSWLNKFLNLNQESSNN
ncbi:MAG: hypothetical protein ACD_2C00052G0004 [uncultured bacterium (gcode 4)]|uniref:Serine aminopeptidase S33 domain-containing protein n=1 Tax=uncultured bacterium (gcode 4) TaxID=1234023 RepID=K2G479_9BACT|nr:MAG: hypothetical protein ACD_2C00052G0004 [uncultured bacterium (gcode 4)]